MASKTHETMRLVLGILVVIGMIYLASAAVVINLESENPDTITQSLNITNFDQYSDTPNSKSGSAGLCPKPNAGESALEYDVCFEASTDKEIANRTFGEMGNASETGFVTVTISDTSTYFNITALGEGNLNDVLFSDSRLEILQTGTYAVNYHVSFSGGANDNMLISTFRNHGIEEKCILKRKLGGGGDLGSSGGSCILNLNAGDVIDLRVRNIDATANPTFHYVDFNIYKMETVRTTPAENATYDNVHVDDFDVDFENVDAECIEGEFTIAEFANDANLVTGGYHEYEGNIDTVANHSYRVPFNGTLKYWNIYSSLSDCDTGTPFFTLLVVNDTKTVGILEWPDLGVTAPRPFNYEFNEEDLDYDVNEGDYIRLIITSFACNAIGFHFPPVDPVSEIVIERRCGAV